MPGRSDLFPAAFFVLAAILAVVSLRSLDGPEAEPEPAPPPDTTVAVGPRYDLAACKADLERMEQALGHEIGWVRARAVAESDGS